MLAILRQLTATEPARTDWQEALACCLKSIGDILETMGALQEALSHHKQCVDIWRTLIARGRGDSALRSHVAYTVEEIAQIQHGLGDLPAAFRACQESQRLWQELVAGEPARLEWQEQLGASYVHGRSSTVSTLRPSSAVLWNWHRDTAIGSWTGPSARRGLRTCRPG